MSGSYTQQYGSDTEPVAYNQSLSNPSSNISYLGKYTRVTVEGKELLLVNPQVIDNLEKQFQELINRSNDLLQRCLRMQQQQTIMTNAISRMERELGNKISYD
jgi:hypothetical protein